MASTSAVGTTQNNPNFLGEIFEIGQNATPLLNLVGGFQGARPVEGVNFALNTNFSLDTASQPSISEDASVTGATPSTYAQAQDENAVQIFQRVASVSYANQSDPYTLSGVPSWGGQSQVTDKMAVQVERNLRQMAVDLEYTMFNGVYVKWTASGTAARTRGISNAITTNSVDAGAVALTKTMVDTLTKSMADNGADISMGTSVIMVNSTYLQALNDIYGLAERSVNVGGVTLDAINTSFGRIPVVYAPKVAQTELLITDVSKISLGVLPVKGQPLLIEELDKDGASDKIQLYGQFGCDYGHEIFHGKITNLA